jgi:broad specificity phosphatase PhoE
MMTKLATFDCQILLMRHAESMEDIDNAIYELAPDHSIGLTQNGQSQALEAAIEISTRIGDFRGLTIFYSPTRRAEETVEIIAAQIRSTSHEAVNIKSNADIRLVKQDWGSVTVANREEQLRRRYEAGALNYKFPDGESGWDVATRMQSFIEELIAYTSPSGNATVIVTHGFQVRIALMILLGWTESEFEKYAQPPNCFIADVRAHENEVKLFGKHPPLYTPGPSHISRVKL